MTGLNSHISDSQNSEMRVNNQEFSIIKPQNYINHSGIMILKGDKK